MAPPSFLASCSIFSSKSSLTAFSVISSFTKIQNKYFESKAFKEAHLPILYVYEQKTQKYFKVTSQYSRTELRDFHVIDRLVGKKTNPDSFKFELQQLKFMQVMHEWKLFYDQGLEYTKFPQNCRYRYFLTRFTFIIMRQENMKFVSYRKQTAVHFENQFLVIFSSAIIANNRTECLHHTVTNLSQHRLPQISQTIMLSSKNSLATIAQHEQSSTSLH